MKSHIFDFWFQIISIHFTSGSWIIPNQKQHQISPWKKASIKVACGCFIIFGGKVDEMMDLHTKHAPRELCWGWRLKARGNSVSVVGTWPPKKPCSGKCWDSGPKLPILRYLYLSKFVTFGSPFWLTLFLCLHFSMLQTTPLSLGRQSSPIRFPVVGQLETWNTSLSDMQMWGAARWSRWRAPCVGAVIWRWGGGWPQRQLADQPRRQKWVLIATLYWKEFRNWLVTSV